MFTQTHATLNMCRSTTLHYPLCSPRCVGMATWQGTLCCHGEPSIIYKSRGQTLEVVEHHTSSSRGRHSVLVLPQNIYKHYTSFVGGIFFSLSPRWVGWPGMLKSTRTRCMTGIQCSICSFISRATLGNLVCPEWPLCYIVDVTLSVTVTVTI